MQNFKERVAIYLRKSRMDPDDENIEETLQRHEDTLLKLAARMELNITGVYREVVSAERLFTRPEMLRLLQDVEQDKYTAVCCVAVDRLGRGSSKDAGIIMETFQDHNVYIITPTKTYDPLDETDETSLDMQSFIARQELKSIKRRLRQGTEKTCEMGYHISEPPYGYRRTYVGKRPTLEIHEDEAKIVRMVYDMYVNQRIGGYTIANVLNDMGLKPRKNDRFSRSTVKFILQNPTYAGMIVWNKRRHIRPKFIGDKHRNVVNPEDQWIISEGVHPAIVSKEMFEKAQKIRETRAHPPAYTGVLQNQFAGLIYCRNCGAAMQRQFSARSGNRLLCTAVNCNRGIQTMYVERYVLDFLRKTLALCRSSATARLTSENDDKIKAINVAIRGLQKNLDTLNMQRSNLHNLLEQQVYDIPTFLDRNKTLAEQINGVTKSIEEQKKKLSSVQNLPPIRDAIPTLERLLTYYDDLTPAEKNELLRVIISKMVYHRGKEHGVGEFDLQITLNYNL